MRMPRWESRQEFIPAMLFCKKYPDCVSGTQRRGSVQRADPLLCGGTFCRYRTHSAAENEGRTAIERRRNECATVLRKATHCLNRTFRFRFPSLPPYEEHKNGYSSQKPGFYPVFCPFLALLPGDKKITKRRYFQDFGGARTHVIEFLTQQAKKN